MSAEPDKKQEEIPGASVHFDAGPQEPGLLDAIRFLHMRRRKFALWTAVLFILGASAFGYYYFSSPKIVEGTVGLSFRGIEKSEYPSGRRFTVEDFRSPGALTKAMADAAIPPERVSLQDLIAHVYITPVIPGEIQGLWNSQNKAGTPREEYSPSEFRIGIKLQVLTDRELIKLFDGLVKYYQESATYDQKSAKGFVNPTGVDYETLAADYDTWDIPDLFRRTFNLLNEKLNNLIAESMQYQNASYQLSLRGIAKDLDTWEQTRLEALEAITYRGRLVRNRDVIAQRIQYQLQNLDIQIRQKSQDATENLQLLAVIEQPKALAGNRETSPILDSSAIDRFVKSDYVRPVVERISRLQEEVQTLQADKARLDNQLSWLPKSTDPIANSLPPGYKSLTTTISREINAIIQNYDRLLENYLTATITSMVTIKQAPVISREVYSPARALPAIALFSMFLAVMLLGIEYLFKKARATRKQRQPAHNQPMSHS